MKELGRLFTGEMVRAIIGGTKSQTRRIVKPRKDANFGCELSPCELAGEINTWDYTNSAYRIGDRIWVRETFHACQHCAGKEGRPTYRADVNDQSFLRRCLAHKKWTPSIFMPRWASRITLEITGIRIERLHDISEDDAQAEGCSIECMTPTGDDSGSSIHGPGGYMLLWKSINGWKSWDANPWVWVLEFKRIK